MSSPQVMRARECLYAFVSSSTCELAPDSERRFSVVLNFCKCNVGLQTPVTLLNVNY